MKKKRRKPAAVNKTPARSRAALPNISLLARLKKLVTPRPYPTLYIFGKHPAWRDFIDVRQMPAVPAGLRAFHQQIRQAVESDFNAHDRPPVAFAWRNGGCCNVVIVFNSHDTPNPETGRSRNSPIFMGLSIRHAGSHSMVLAIKFLNSLAAHLLAPGRTAKQFVDAVTHAVKLVRRPMPDPKPSVALRMPLNASLTRRLQFGVSSRGLDSKESKTERRTKVVRKLPTNAVGPIQPNYWLEWVVRLGLFDRDFQLLMIPGTHLCYVILPSLQTMHPGDVHAMLACLPVAHEPAPAHA